MTDKLFDIAGDVIQGITLKASTVCGKKQVTFIKITRVTPTMVTFNYTSMGSSKKWKLDFKKAHILLENISKMKYEVDNSMVDLSE